MFFANSSEGWAVGEGGVIINTRDVGAQWSSQNSGTNQPLEAVHFAPPGPNEVLVSEGWAVGGGGTIVYTTNRGTNWRPQPVKDMVEPLYGVFFDDEQRGWAVGKDGTVLRTTDGGLKWGLSAAAAAKRKSLYDVFFIDAANGWAAGSGGKLLHSPDGRNWEAVETESMKDIGDPLWGIAFIDSKEGELLFPHSPFSDTR